MDKIADKWHRNEDILANAQSALLRSIKPMGQAKEGLYMHYLGGQGRRTHLTGHRSDLKLVPGLGVDEEDVFGEWQQEGAQRHLRGRKVPF